MYSYSIHCNHKEGWRRGLHGTLLYDGYGPYVHIDCYHARGEMPITAEVQRTKAERIFTSSVQSNRRKNYAPNGQRNLCAQASRNPIDNAGSASQAFVVTNGLTHHC